MSERRRRTPRAERTSDVTRFRGVALAALAAAAVTVAAVLVLSRGGSPGPLARPHVVAGIACASCHDGPSLAAACTACHGPRYSTRGPHQALAARGELRCTSCHTAHGGGGVALLADGHEIRYGAGAEVDAGVTSFRPHVATSIPLLAAAGCAHCHDLASPRDPIAACLVAGQDALGPTRPTVCFDEHHAVRDATGTIAPRAAAWDAARELAATLPLAPAGAASPPTAPWSWLGAGALAAGLVLTGSRLRRRKRAPAPTPAVTPLRRLPVIDTATCLGCYACVDACPYDVLEIHRYVAFVARPADCCGLILCEQKCPNGSLAMAFADDHQPAAGLALADNFESRTVPGLFVAGDIGGQPLIRNAINQGAQVARAIAKSRSGPLDLVIVGVGPAGLAAALEAHARGLRYIALEQATIADSIHSFPRGKLVIDPDLPNTSALWLAEATKEELLARWTRTVREVRPHVREGMRVTRIATGATFTVDAVDADGRVSSYEAAQVVIAIGRRGTPRRLAAEVPPAMVDHVHYSLADARSFAGRRVLVVGLGDVAMEAAIALSRQPATEVVVAARATEFRRGKARNIAEIRRRVASGNVRVVWQSEVAALHPGRVELATPTGTVEVACDAVFVLIGSIPAEELLRQVGLLQDQIVPEPGASYGP